MGERGARWFDVQRERFRALRNGKQPRSRSSRWRFESGSRSCRSESHDFGNRDEDGAVRLVTRGAVEHLKSHGITLSEACQSSCRTVNSRLKERARSGKVCVVAIVSRWTT